MLKTSNLHINLDRLLNRIETLAQIGAIEDGGISHNVAEYTEPEHLRAGADDFLQVLLARSCHRVPD